MSANREDALKELRGSRLPFDAPAPRGPDPTEDLADEITSELVASPTVVRTAPADAPAQRKIATGGNILRDRYVLETQLGAGGTAVVYRAVDLRRDASLTGSRQVAIKVLRPELRDSPHAVARMQREFRQSLAAAHTGVVRVFDLDCDRGAWFIVMELLSGSTLGMTLRRADYAGLPVAEALRIACAAGDALSHAHTVGVVHGDVKPDNIFLAESGELRLLDFGVAPEPSSGADERVPVSATRLWASPEVLSGENPVPRDDVFSLACVTYELLAGAHPYGRRRPDSDARPAGAPARIPSLDDARWAALESALSPGRDERPDMAEFVRALRGGERRSERPAVTPEVVPPAEPAIEPTPERAAAVALPATVALPAAVATQAPPRGRKHLLVMALAALLALLVGILIGRAREPKVVVAPPAPAAQPPVVAAAEPAVAALVPPERDAPRRREAEPPLPAPVTPGFVFFDSPRMTVSKHAVVAAIPIRNLRKDRRAVKVEWRIIEGTARVGRDFGGPLAGTESFVEGNNFRILYIPILQNPAAMRDRRFTVELTSASAGTDVGPTPRIEITILGAA